MSPTPPKWLDPLRFSLRGNRLIEASAGTGKTFTIAALYLRLVLGHGGEAAFDRPLNPPDILVVTFTEAATQELRGRIRDRLAQAARCFEAGAAADGLAGQGFDDLLLELRAGYPTAEWPACAARLRLAAEWMDEAAVSTIHAWCQRMLSEHAFDSGSLFTQQLEADQRELMRLAQGGAAAARLARAPARRATPGRGPAGRRRSGCADAGRAAAALGRPGGLGRGTGRAAGAGGGGQITVLASQPQKMDGRNPPLGARIGAGWGCCGTFSHQRSLGPVVARFVGRFGVR